MHIIEVIVSPAGETRIQTQGYGGSSCLQASRFLEEALGAVTEDQKTAEFYQPGTVTPHEKNQA